MIYEYVMSGLSFLKIKFSEFEKDENYLNYITNTFNKLNTSFDEQRFSVLYNAYTEAKQGEEINKYFKNCCENIYADSGGLQVMTLGKDISDEFKTKIYENQSKFSSKAMSFDKIPVITAGGSKNLDIKSRCFDRENYRDYAVISGKDLLNQIGAFLNHKTTSVPIAILHGNCIDTYVDWFHVMMEQIPDRLKKYIGGVAFGGGAIGQGTLEDITRAFTYSLIQDELYNKHLHVLGIGSTARFLPYIIFYHSGAYKDSLISYDSTTHCGRIRFGQYYLGEEWYDFAPKLDKTWVPFYEDVTSEFDLDGITIEEFYALIGNIKSVDKAKYGTLVYKSTFAAAMNSCQNFMKHIDKILKDEKRDYLHNKKLVDKKEYIAYTHLYSVKTLEDFKEWERQFGRYLNSNRTPSEFKPTIEDFFE